MLAPELEHEFVVPVALRLQHRALPGLLRLLTQSTQAYRAVPRARDSGKDRASHPLPNPVWPYPSLTAESHLQVPVALNSKTMTLWAALALLSLFTYPWELSSGAFSPLLSREHSFI